jgi:hypothetical protein
MYSKKVKNLICNHKLHIKCYESLISSNYQGSKTCPVCRYDINSTIPPPPPSLSSPQPIQRELLDDNFARFGDISFLPREDNSSRGGQKIKCSFCKNNIEFNDKICDFVKINDCKCYSNNYAHYECVKKERKKNMIIECNCGIRVNYTNIDLISYLNSVNAFTKIVGDITTCKEKKCTSQGDPKRYGFCEIHNSSISSNTAFAISLRIMLRYIFIDDKIKRAAKFYKILSEINSPFFKGANPQNAVLSLEGKYIWI